MRKAEDKSPAVVCNMLTVAKAPYNTIPTGWPSGIRIDTKKATHHMTRCDYDAVFYRVFCITLLAIAFTFTVILTNVFVDIDGLLASKKEKFNDNTIHSEYTTETSNNDEINYGESDDSYRTKRSIETQSFLFHIKNPKVKNILANRLSTLLEELEAEETADMKATEQKTIEDIPKIVQKQKLADDEKRDKMLHLRMHNILLQGIEKHMDLNEVYKRMYALMSNFNQFHDRKDAKNLKPIDIGKEGDDPKIKKPIEDKFFDEMLNCVELQDQIVQSTTVKPAKASPNVMVKTVIDITSLDNDKLKENDTKITNENIEGDIELVYNGKVIKFTKADAKIAQPTPHKALLNTVKPEKTIETTITETNDYKMIPKSYMNKFVEEYFKQFPRGNKDTNDEINRHFQTKRLKRHVRIKYENEDPGQPKKSVKKNTEEDELYVEIETHFDSKGMKGEKKKKLIKNLIEKIQKAIHPDMTKKITITGKNNTKQRKNIHFKKRAQNPLEHSTNHVYLNKYSLPIDNYVHRQLHPISKTVPLHESMSPYIGTKSGEEWKKPNFGPGFLADTKAINSAEMSEVKVDYSKILEVNGIPQRLQQPLNTELSEETIKTNSYYDMGKRKFVIKDIDGSGFSVGFNQYVDEPPDKEYMRLFSGLENVIKSYHETYDPPPEPIPVTEADLESEDRPMEPPIDEHIIERRSIDKNHDYHSNEYKVIFNNDFLNYKNYRDIYKTKKEKPKIKAFEEKTSPLIVDENIFEKKLNPSEIFSLANLLQRKKRGINVKKINNLSSRLKFNKFLNTNAKSKTLFLNTKRNKRQINKIRIIASDMPHITKQSDENVFVVSNENVFADRALVKEVETFDDHEKPEEYTSQNNEPGNYITKIFDGRFRHNPLMSKYPHIFMEEVSRSREEYIPNNALLFSKLPGVRKVNTDEDNSYDNIDIEQFLASTNDTEPQKQIKNQETINGLTVPSANKANYKMTVKIVPKNQTGLNSGFKEIHTSINKSFNKNGLLYSSLVNVSEISKVIKLNRTLYEGAKDDKVYTRKDDTSLTKKIQDQQEKMQFLLKQHAEHINEQLNRLNEEKINLESMLNGDIIDNNGEIDSNALNASIRRLKLDSREIVSTTTRVTPKEVQTTTVTVKPREELPQTTTQPSPPTQIQGFSEKIKNNNIISTIERNGNLTDQILHKIDRNTEILTMFLQKLSERMDVIPTASMKPEKVKDDNTSPPDWRNQAMPFTQNMVIRKNDSHISIPFTYAYQPPTSPSLQVKTQVASVVYQGHIRNAVRHRDNPHPGEQHQVQKISEVNNQSKFFIDELENEYKVIQMGGLKKTRDFNMVSKKDGV